MASSETPPPPTEAVAKLDVAGAPAPDEENGPSKSAVKKAAKAERLAAEKKEKKTKVAQAGKAAATNATTKTPAKNAKIQGAALIGVGVDKALDFAGWYQQVLTKSDLIDYYDIQGCYILKPGSWSIWEKIQRGFNHALVYGLNPHADSSW
jgi:prolyl-tRNA synthetase